MKIPLWVQSCGVALGLAIVVACATAGSTSISQPVVPGASVLSNGTLGLTGFTETPAAGDLAGATAGARWYDSTRKAPRGCSAIGNTTFPFVMDVTTADSTTLSNPTANTTFSQFATALTGSLVAGRAVRMTAFGKYTTGTALTPTLDIGWNVSGTQLASSGLVSTAVSLTDKAWRSTCVFVVRTAGSSGTMFANVESELGGLLTSPLPTLMVGRSGSFTVNTTVDNRIAPAAKFGVSDASNAITCEGLLAEILN